MQILQFIKPHCASYIVYPSCNGFLKNNIGPLNNGLLIFILGIPDQTEWNLDPNASYVYYCANETIHGNNQATTFQIV